MTALDKIGRYQVLGELGRGAMGVVYRARDPVIGRVVALKTFPVGAGSAEAKRLHREAQVTGLLSHPGIVTIFDVIEDAGGVYICMECVEGPTLESLLSARKPLTPSSVMALLRQSADALDYAHHKGIVHRDIKPGNIMLHEDRIVKITDFGIAKVLAEDATIAGPMLGTPSYMAPEQIQSRPVGGRADQFALATIAYELMTGQKPFAGYSLASIVYKVCHDPPPAASSLNTSLPPAVDRVFERAMAKDPAGRFANVTQFADALESAIGDAAWTPVTRGESASGEPTIVAPVFALRPRKKRSAAVFAVLFALLGFAAVAAAIYLFTPRESAPPPPVVQFNVPPAVIPEAVAPADKPSPSGEEDLSATTPPVVTSPPPGPPTPVSTHTFSMDSTPSGAAIEVDNIPGFGCTTPCRMSLTGGRHTLKANLAGHRPTLKIVELPQETSVQFAFVRQTGTVMAKSNPPGATIFVDGREWPSKTPTLLTLPAGPHKLLFRKEGMRDEESDIEVRDGAVMNLDINWLNP